MKVHGKKPEDTLTKIDMFLKDDLRISDPSSLALVDYNRFPQRPLFRNETKVIRPIILKLTTMQDKRQIYAKLKNLKTYNYSRKTLNKKPVFIADH